LAIRGNRYVICSDEEFQSAKAEQRQPLTLAFPEADIIGVVPEPEILKRGPKAEPMES
jgi:hypothetical protein